MRLVKNNTAPAAGATVAQISYADSLGYGALGASERRGAPVFAPRGIAYLPCEGDNVLLVPADGTEVCAGVLASSAGLRAGELRLTSSGGASILLDAEGGITLNGVYITKDGRILPPAGQEE